MPSDPKRVQAVFVAAAEQPAADRAALLARECGGDPELRQRVEALLKAHDEPGSFLENPAVPPADLPGTIGYRPITEGPGARIGPYKLLQQIGEGGMGVVYMAEQLEPVKRKVALKIIKPGMDSKLVVARFEAERQALALMDHPNIARVLDAGATEDPSPPTPLPADGERGEEKPPRGKGKPPLAPRAAWGEGSGVRGGRPYFVMDLVRGIPITEYCDQNNLTPRERLDLFVQVCRAMQHAHQKGVIHRDLKPSNVMVTLHDGVPVPKIIDFGIAKAINQELTERTLFTQFGQMVGTPLYMSPEQAEMSGLDTDTRTDIYSLGVLLYELLTGTTPFDKERLRSAAFDEIRRIIREEEPPKPSTRLSELSRVGQGFAAHQSPAGATAGVVEDGGPRRLGPPYTLATIAARRKTEPVNLTKLLRGDLDWIVMKALEKDRTRRYETASEFAADIVRHLNHEPVVASPPSATYRLRKFLRKHRGPAAAVAAVVAALAIGLADSLWMYFRAERLREQAVDARAQEEGARQAESLRARELQQALGDVTTERNLKNDALTAKDAALRRSEALRLTAHSSAVLAENPGLALLLGIEAARREPQLGPVNNALLAALGACREERTLFHTGTPEYPVTFRDFELRSAAMSPDGSRVLAATNQNSVAVWDWASGRLLCEINKPSRLPPMYPQFSPDGSRVLARFTSACLDAVKDVGDRAYTDRVVRVFDAVTGKELTVLRGHGEAVATVRFSPDGRRVLTASWDGTARVWDLVSGAELNVFKGEGSCTSASFSPDGKRVLGVFCEPITSMNGTIWKFVGRPEPDVIDPPFNPDEVILTCWHRALSGGGFDNDFSRRDDREVKSHIRVWDIERGTEAMVIGLDRHWPQFVTADFDPEIYAELNEKTQFLSIAGNVVEFWDPSDGDRLAERDLGELGSLLAVSPDRHKLFGKSSLDGTDSLRVYDLESNKEIVLEKASLPGSPEFFFGWHVPREAIGGLFTDGPGPAKFNHDGSRVVAAIGSAAVIWDTTTGKQLLALRGHENAIRSVAFSRDCRRVITAGYRTARIWRIDVGWDKAGSAAAGPPIAGHGNELDLGMVLTGHTSGVICARFSPDGKRIATGSADATTRIWDAATGKQLGVLKGHAALKLPKIRDQILGEVFQVNFSRDGGRLVSVSRDLGAYLQKNADDDAPGELLPFTPARVWNVENAEELIALKGNVLDPEVIGAFHYGFADAVFIPDGTAVVTTDLPEDRYGNFLSDGGRRGGGVRSGGFSVSKEGKALGPYLSIRVWNPATGELVRAIGAEPWPHFPAVSPDGRRGFTKSNVTVWDTLTGSEVCRLQPVGWDKRSAGPPDQDPGREPDAHPIPTAEGAVFSPDGRWLLTNISNVAHLWDAHTGNQLAVLIAPDVNEEARKAGACHDASLTHAAFSADGRRLVTASQDRTARVWDVPSGKYIATLQGHQLQLHFAAFSPDSQRIATASEDATARLWHAETGREFLILKGHTGPVRSAVFSPDGQSVLTASADGTARVWPTDPLRVALARKPRELTPEERARFELEPTQDRGDSPR